MATISTPSLVDLAHEILKLAHTLQTGLDARGLPQPRFSSDGRLNYHDIQEDQLLIDARSSLIETSQAMLNLAQGPVHMLLTLCGAERANVAVLHTVNELEIYRTVPHGRSISVLELARTIKVHPRLLERVMRHAYTMRMFHEPQPGYVAHTSLSAAIADLSPFLSLQLGPLLQLASAKLPQSLQIWSDDAQQLEGASSCQIPFQMADRLNRTFWQSVEHDDPDGRGMDKFSMAMRAGSIARVGHSYAQFTRTFDWAALCRGPVVDLGGGNGHIAVAIAKAFPELEFVVQDLESNRAAARRLIEHPDNAHALATSGSARASMVDRECGQSGDTNGRRSRVTFMAHSFLEPQPELSVGSHLAQVPGSQISQKTPKAYLVCRILHDWPDSDCLTILRHLVPAMEKSRTKSAPDSMGRVAESEIEPAKLFIVDRVLPSRHPDDKSTLFPSSSSVDMKVDSDAENNATGKSTTMTLHKEQQLRFMDLLMFQLFGSSERSLVDWADLLRKADPRLKILKATQPTFSDFGMLEVGLVG